MPNLTKNLPRWIGTLSAEVAKALGVKCGDFMVQTKVLFKEHSLEVFLLTREQLRFVTHEVPFYHIEQMKVPEMQMECRTIAEKLVLKALEGDVDVH